MNRYLSAIRKIQNHSRPLRFVISRILLRLKIALPIAATFSRDPEVKVYLTSNPIAHTAWLSVSEPPEVEIFKKYITVDAIVFDVGANVGTHALLAAKLAPAGQVYAFEPGAKAHEALCRNIVLNNVENLTTYNAAVSTGETAWELKQPGRSDEQSFLVPASDAESTLNIIRLEDVLTENAIQQIDFLKIDVEGAELLVLKSLGERLTDVRKIFFENIPSMMERFGYTHTELYEFLTQQEFAIHTFDVVDGEIILTPVTSLLDTSSNVLATR